jgi:hypothetical protein
MIETCRLCLHDHEHFAYVGVTWRWGLKYLLKRCALCGEDWPERIREEA